MSPRLLFYIWDLQGSGGFVTLKEAWPGLTFRSRMTRVEIVNCWLYSNLLNPMLYFEVLVLCKVEPFTIEISWSRTTLRMSWSWLQNLSEGCSSLLFTELLANHEF